jgi:hypothetical protein
MKERGVALDEVEEILTHPEYTAPSAKERKNAFGILNGRYLRVTYKEHSQELLIITVVLRKRPFGEKAHEN